MARRCAFCGKKPMVGNTIARRGMAKAKGGAGRKITGITSRKFFPNLQRIKTIIDGKKQTVYTCVKCLKAGKVKRCQ